MLNDLTEIKLKRKTYKTNKIESYFFSLSQKHVVL